MFDKIRITDWNSIIYSIIILWPTFMFSMVYIALAWHFVKDYRAGLEMLKNLRTNEIVIFVVAGLISLPFFIAMYKALHWPAFLCIEDNGEWRCRNTFYYTLAVVPPEMPRRIEGSFTLTRHESSTEKFFTGYMKVWPENDSPFSLAYTAYPLENGEPDFFKKFGYPDSLVLMPGPDGGKITPWHAWNNYGYVYLPDKNQAEYHGEPLAE